MTQLSRFICCRKAVQRAAILLLAAAGLVAAGAQAQSDNAGPGHCDQFDQYSVEGVEKAPTLTGGTLAQARDRLRDYELDVEVVEVASDEPSGQVVNQWPKPGEGMGLRTLVLCVSRGPARIPMPSLLGMTPERAKQVLAARRLPTEPEIRTARHPTAARGTIYRQSPRAGAQLIMTEPPEIVVDVSEGPPDSPPPSIAMPSVMNMTVDEARQRLAAQQIANQPEIRRAPHPAAAAGTIFAQSPAEGAPLTPADAIVLSVSAGLPPSAPQGVIVPQLRGMAEGEAVARLEREGLIAVARGSRHSAYGAGQVIETNPAAGERVEPGRPIYYALSLGPALPPQPETRSRDRDWLVIAILTAAALAAAALAAKLAMAALLPRFEVRMAGPPMPSIEWGEPPGLEFEVGADPPVHSCRLETANLPGETRGGISDG